MSAEEDRLPLVAETENDVAHVLATDRIKPGHGLVQNHQFGIVNQRLGEADPLQHAFGKFS